MHVRVSSGCCSPRSRGTFHLQWMCRRKNATNLLPHFISSSHFFHVCIVVCVSSSPFRSLVLSSVVWPKVGHAVLACKHPTHSPLPIAHTPIPPPPTSSLFEQPSSFLSTETNNKTGQESTTQQGLTNHPNGLWWSGDDKTRPDKFRQDDAAHQQSTVAASEFVFSSSLTNKRTNDERTLSFAFFGCSPPLCDGSNVFSFAPSFPLQLATWRRPLVCFMLTFLLLLWGWRSEKWVGR